MTSKMLLICLAVVCLAYKTSAYSSCQDIYMADNRNSNGNYVIHHNGSAINVYCSFESNYGYTYISKQSYNTELNISLLYTTLDFAKIRHRKSNGIQKEVIVENLSSFQSRSTLYFGYNANTSYQGPDRNNVGLKPYLFLGFLPESFLRNYETQGYRAAGKDFTFKNCDKNPNSYITFYYNPNNTTPGRLGYTNHFMKGWIDESELLPMNNYMDTDFYFDWEMHMGGCGGFMTSHCLSNNRAALGLPFSIKPCDGLNCQNGGSCDSSVSPACCICVGNYFGDRCENINGGWTEWSVWSDCPDTCGDENLTRTRSCTNPSPENNGTVCQGHTSETISCTTAKCPVNGGWTEWSVWSDCPETCGDEYLTRTRSCTNPSPENNGTDCQGNNTETLSCSTAQCPVNGGWTEWSVWSDCPETCSDEILIRTRSCTNPSPDNNGTACQGNTTETISCSTAKCPVNGKWTEWSVWSDCPETCGDEDLIRTRSCTNPSPGNNGTVCQGSNTETISCTTAQCPVNGGWTEWSIWSDCPETCDDEDLTRTRSCTNPSPENNGTVCQGNTTETISCHTANCPVNGGWTEWSVWSDCPKTCGDEDLIRTRSCSNPSPENNGTVCQGSNTETIPCTTAQCPVNGGWTEWSVWSDCPDTCGDEDLIRTRSCTNPSPENNGTVCQGHDSETIPCYTANCPVNGGWTEWSVWSDCPETCGNEDLIRTRSCTNPSPENNGTVCQGSNTETISCTTAQCPVNGGWTEWSAWSDCPDTCNDEDLIRTRSCTNPSPENNGTVCQGHDSETIPCYTANCPVNGGWTEWSVWSDCPETCGNEDLIRTRSCTNPSPENNGTVCQGSNTETISCTTAQCPVNGGWTEWSAWSDCPDTCNDEDLIRTRSCTNPSPENNGTVCQGHDSETIPCYTANCPVNGGWTEWSVWSDCPETCGNEDLIRTRSCTNPSPENNGTVCQGSNTETISCTTAQCPVNGGWTEWSVWSDCPDTCGDEDLIRTRACTNPSPENNGTVCQGHDSETIPCYTANCPVNGGWTEWSVWSDCPETCGNEDLIRTRSCTNPSPENNGTVCQGSNTETISCTTAQCPVNGGWTEWSVWSDCPDTCGDEDLIRTRACTNPSPENNGTVCQGHDSETIPCYTANCPVNGGWTEWSVWSDCPETCGNEDLIRTRSCTNPSPENNGTVCQGSNTETISCTTAQCPVNGGWTEWSVWSDCPDTCGDEDLFRTRSCANPSPENNGTVCQGHDSETIPCYTANCPVNGGWTEWSVWSDCPETCGNEDLIRTRSCTNPSPENNGTVCQGSNTEIISCTTAQCPVNGGWTEWSVWSDCPETCGDEDLIRTRSCTNPSPENNGTVCQGSNTEIISCTTAQCPVNGGWTEWSVWSDCPETCGDEDLIRTRSCTNPSPENNGTVCQGSNTEIISCTTAQCPVNGGWTEWSVWSDCPDTCGDEDLIRTRSCTNPSPENNGTVCQGHDSETIPCYTANCPVNGGWTEWSVWSDCPETCGDEDLIRTRSCTNPSPENNGTVCQGSNTETISCTTAQCPVNGGWTEWSVWSGCPDTCGDEDLIRTRLCTNPSPENNGTVCQGHDSETIPCYTANCPVNGGWTEWSVWSDCPETCGNEDLIRTRSCTNPSPENNGTVCQGSNTEIISCTTAQCPVNGGWTEWSVWSDCPETCGDEDLIRTRSCTNPSPENNGTVCQGNNTEKISCTTAQCQECWTNSIHTDNVYEYQLLSDLGITVTIPNLIKFKVKANNDAHLALLSSANENDSLYEIVIGGWGNTKSVIRDKKQGDHKATHLGQVLNPNEYQTFYVTWKDGNIRVEDENNVKLMEWTDTTNPLTITNVGISTGFGASGDWQFPLACQVNGGWTDWSVWSDCPETCNDEDLIRTRSCTNPSPDNNGTACQGNNTETISCYTANCPVNGEWTEWSVWSDCPDTCRDESLIRTRSCTNPSPENNGTVCQGNSSETISCTIANCPVNGGWTEWSVWSDCPETCNDEDLIRTRSCTNPSPDNNGTVCQGNTTETISCHTAICQVNGGWTEWSVWSDCPDTCRDESLVRTRSCTNPSPENNGTVCQGNSSETISCTIANCPVNGGWTEWSVWSDCPETCNDEDLIRTRSCTNPSPDNNGTACQGSNTETVSCYTANCQVNGGWTEWSVWSDCPDTCSDESLIRTRSCTNPSPENNGTACQGNSSETISCTLANCPVNGGWTEWSVWSDCPETCNDEDLIRTRSCTNPSQENNGTVCQGSNTETISCTTANCPVNGGWTEWSIWSDCPETCDDEDLIRTRSCTNPSPENNGTVCQGNTTETIACTTAKCPVNGGWTEWSVWSDCPETCGDEDLIRTRSCTNPSPENNGTVCQGNNTETISCYTANCPVNGGWTEWSVWSDCPETCGDEDLIRTRSCTNPSPENNGTVCQGSNTETISCSTAQCPVNGGWSTWTPWSSCPETCNGETLNRTRSCSNPESDNNGTDCQGNDIEYMSCQEAPCPVNGGWTTWTPWSSCPETCNDEYLNRTRSCSNPASVNNGTDCQGNDIEFKSCQTADCPVNGGWTTWSSWTSCPETCNGEKLSRTRSCSNPESDNNGTDCQGIDIEYISCQEAKCPVNGQWSTWTSWTSCPETCNGEYLNRTRTCSNPASENNGTDCQGDDIEFKSCQTADCPVDGSWTSWSSWSDCPDNCNGEILSRKRNCTNPMPQNGGKQCIGNETETSSCEAIGCPCIVDGGWSPWSSWSACPYSCHGHVLTRDRTCTNPVPTHGGTDCTGNSTDTTSCESQGCPCKGYLHFDMGSGFTRLSFNWKLFGVLSAVLFVWR